MPSPRTVPSTLLAALLFLAPGLSPGHLLAGPGLLVRNAERYYQAPVSRLLHQEERLPSSPPESMLLPFQEEDLMSLRAAGYLEDYQGPDWDRPGACTRYQAAFLLGGFLQELTDQYGEVLRERKTGVRRRLLPRKPWGRERVARTLALPLLSPRSRAYWWDESPDRYQLAGWMLEILRRLGDRVLVLRDPRPYRQASRSGDLPIWGHPLRRRTQQVLEAHLMAAPQGYFRGREPLGARELVRIVNRLRFLVNGYHDRTAGAEQVDAGL